MSVTDAVGSIQQIQSRLSELFGPKTSATDSTSDTTFASALAQANGLAGASAVSSSTGVANPLGATGADVVADARKYLGVPYVFGGEDASGMDCSGLVQRVYADLGITLPRVVPDQAKMGVEVPSLAQAQPGDLIVLKGEDHIVIYAGDGKVIHAPSAGRNVQVANAWMNDSQIATIRRIVPSASDAAASTGLAGLSSLAGSNSTTLASLSSLAGSNSTTLSAALRAALTSGATS
ncbi:C40 family peptidase [Microbacterium sp. STN6]|uniref:C40 family peptidase n=1 Tax=Microbacterium sp. STN6 TaxID=2995588 RepID=UPI002260AED1|nr:C40 family peptidase [Microbacterium sp. STN6]MCX7522384.1 C40 family peptidase [Microbacterium sp. STN6]